jgi:hypothetical protein
MKRVILISGIFILALSTYAHAKVVIISDAETKEIYCISGKDDTVVPAGHKKDILAGDMTDYKLQYPVSCYKFKNDKITVDMKAVDNMEKELQEVAAKKEEQEAAKKTAIEKLKALGLSDIEIEALTVK